MFLQSKRWSGPQSLKPALILLLILVCSPAAFADEILVAAASDLNFPLKEIIAGFARQTGTTVRLTLGSSGTFQAQIANGAPFDVFMSADINYVRQLEQQNLVEPGSVSTYAVGKIVIWVPNGSPIDVEKDGIRALVSPAAKRVAIANPDHAPYGRAAVAALRHFGVYDSVKAKLVMGENISQAAQFVSSGAADIGVIALSLALSDAMKKTGHYWEIPVDSYPRLEQGMAVLLEARKSGHLDAAKAFREWVSSPESQAILQKYGFLRP